MKRYGVAVTALISLVFFVSMAGPRASAQSPSRFDSFLQSGGFTVVLSSPVRYAGISQMGEARGREPRRSGGCHVPPRTRLKLSDITPAASSRICPPASS